jgi:hypothetical protein
MERFLSDTSWPKDLVLDLEKCNWEEWRRRVKALAYKQGFAPWLNGSLECPDEGQYPEAHWVWQQNDHSLRGFFLGHVSLTDFTLVENLPSGHEMFEALRNRHERFGLFAQVLLLRKALAVSFKKNTPFSETIAQLQEYHDRILALGELDSDRLCAVVLLNALGDRFSHFQSVIQAKPSSTLPASFSSEYIVKSIKEYLIQHHFEQSLLQSSTAVVNAAAQRAASQKARRKSKGRNATNSTRSDPLNRTQSDSSVNSVHGAGNWFI